MVRKSSISFDAVTRPRTWEPSTDAAPVGDRRDGPNLPVEAGYIRYCTATRRVRNPLLTPEVTRPRLTAN